MPFKVTSALLCDDVRTENNGKLILIGVYLGAVGVKSFPLNFRPVVYLEFEPGFKNDTKVLEFNLAPAGAKAESTKMDIQIDDEDRVLVVRPAPPIILTEPSELWISARLGGGRWVRAKQFAVTSTNPPAS